MNTKDKSKPQQGNMRFIRFSGKYSRQRAAAFTLAALLCCAAIGIATRAYYPGKTATGASNSSLAMTGSPEPLIATVQDTLQTRSPMQFKLALQPEADRMRRRLGQRFLKEGREMAVLTGTLTVGSTQQSVRITRTQVDQGEAVLMALDGGQSLSWNTLEGAKSNGRIASNTERALIERIVFDSPDQFILSQLRGSAYSVIARDARPAEAIDAESYNGSTWDVFQVSEPAIDSSGKPISQYRLYLINSSTRLIDKVFSKEGEDTIVAEISGWSEQNGEKFPTQITWNRNQQPLMSLVISSISYGAKQ